MRAHLRLMVLLASMRPQHITAENDDEGADQLEASGCFNEAAAYHCGKRGIMDVAVVDTRELQ